MVYAHRRYSSLLIQTFRVYNPMDWDNTVKIEKGNLKNWTELVSLRLLKLQRKSEIKNHAPEEVTYQVACGIVRLPSIENIHTNTQVLLVVVYEPVFPDNLTVPSGSSTTSISSGLKAYSHKASILSSHDLRVTL
ncbi:unnamed protein product [Trichobilharzia regenti]|nr:unnamed protein product [Trichobilharzia regenti]